MEPGMLLGYQRRRSRKGTVEPLAHVVVPRTTVEEIGMVCLAPLEDLMVVRRVPH